MLQPSVKRIFEYTPNQIRLVGFPRSAVLTTLGRALGTETSLSRYNKTEQYGRVIPYLVPSFPPEQAEARQNFFTRLHKSRVTKSVFDIDFPEWRDTGRSAEDFLNYCQGVYRATCKARDQLKNLRHLPEARVVVTRLNSLDTNLEKALATLDSLDNAHTFAADTKTGEIVPIKRMPQYRLEVPKRGTGWDWELGNTEAEIKLRLKKLALKLAQQGISGFREKIISFVKSELQYSPNEENVRSCFEALAVPIRLQYAYTRLLERCMESSEEDLREGRQGLVAKLNHPRFAQHYDIRNLFPPSLLEAGGHKQCVPIDFKTKRGEKKFLLAGLQSGGKSFFLENLVLLSLLTHSGLDLLGDSPVLPKYNRILYYSNPNNSGNDSGKFLTGMGNIEEIANEAKTGDGIFFDDFLDSGAPHVTTWYSPIILEKLRKSGATVFVSTHRAVNYKQLQREGWVIMSPEHRIKDGKVVPSRKLKRGIPDPEINRRYVEQEREKFLKKNARL